MVIILENKVTIFRKLMSVRMTFHHRSGVTNEPRVLAGEQQHLIRRRVASCQPFLSQTESVMREVVSGMATDNLLRTNKFRIYSELYSKYPKPQEPKTRTLSLKKTNTFDTPVGASCISLTYVCQRIPLCHSYPVAAKRERESFTRHTQRQCWRVGARGQQRSINPRCM